MPDTTTVGPDIVSELDEMFESNARTVQEINGRELEMDTKAG